MWTMCYIYCIKTKLVDIKRPVRFFCIFFIATVRVESSNLQMVWKQLYFRSQHVWRIHKKNTEEKKTNTTNAVWPDRFLWFLNSGLLSLENIAFLFRLHQQITKYSQNIHLYVYALPNYQRHRIFFNNNL